MIENDPQGNALPAPDGVNDTHGATPDGPALKAPPKPRKPRAPKVAAVDAAAQTASSADSTGFAQAPQQPAVPASTAEVASEPVAPTEGASVARRPRARAKPAPSGLSPALPSADLFSPGHVDLAPEFAAPREATEFGREGSLGAEPETDASEPGQSAGPNQGAADGEERRPRSRNRRRGRRKGERAEPQLGPDGQVLPPDAQAAHQRPRPPHRAEPEGPRSYLEPTDVNELFAALVGGLDFDAQTDGATASAAAAASTRQASTPEGDEAGGDSPRAESAAGSDGGLHVATSEAREAPGDGSAGLASHGLPGTTAEPGELRPGADGPGLRAAPALPGKRVLAPEPDAPKLHKVLAQSGVGSRRDLEQWITEGRVTVNGEVSHTGQRISFGDRIQIDGKAVRVRIAPPLPRVLAYHKPAGEVVTHDDPQARPTVFRRLPRLQQGKWQSVGRLDINTEGLLLFTNSGDLANRLMHPRFGVEREYAVRALGSLVEEERAKLLAGVEIDGQLAAFNSIEDGGGEGVNHWYRVVITEGRNREVRNLFASVGKAVSRLIRIRYGSVVLPRGLKRGAWVDLAPDDVKALRDVTGMAMRQGGGSARGEGRQDGRNDGRFEGRPDGRNEARQDGRNDGAGQGRPAGPFQGRPDSVAPQDRGRRKDGRRDRGGHTGPRGAGGPVAQRPQREHIERQPVDPRYQGPRFEGHGHVPDYDADHDAEQRGPIPNPLQQTFDKRAIQQARKQREYSEDGPIPNPLQQTYDKRALQSDNRSVREVDEDGPIPNPLQQTYDKRFASNRGAGQGFGPGGGGGQRGRSGGGSGGGSGGYGPGGGQPGNGKPARRKTGPGGPGKGGGGAERQPDPMRTSVGYIGGDAFLKKGRGGGAGRGAGGGGSAGGGGGPRGAGGTGGPRGAGGRGSPGAPRAPKGPNGPKGPNRGGRGR